MTAACAGQTYGPFTISAAANDALHTCGFHNSALRLAMATSLPTSLWPLAEALFAL